MILASGFLACFVYCFAIGMLWPSSSHFGRWLAWASTIAKALWISWLIAVSAFLFRINNPLPICLLVIAAGGLTRMLNPVDWPLLSRLNGRKKYILDLFVIASLLLISYTALSHIPTPQGLFTEWDAVVSWNRWAIEWTNNKYEPATAAYPILFPAIWSLIYRAQETSEIWFVAKLSMYLVPILCVLILASLAEQSMFITAIIATIGFAFMVLNFGEATVSGYMDAPVALMILACGLWMILITSKPTSSESLWPLSALVGVTAITKQAGVVMFLPYLFVLFLQSRSTKSPWQFGMKQLLVLLIPLITFLALYLTRETSPIGNLGFLTNIAANTAGQDSSLFHAFDLLFNGGRWWALLPLCGLAFLNTRKVREPVALMGSIFLLLSICLFPVFATCCSYDARNGWWLVSFLLLSALCGVAGFEHQRLDRISPISQPAFSNKSRLIILLTGSTLVILASFWLPNKRLLALQTDLQWNVGYPSISALIRKHRDLITTNTKLITTYMPSYWLPGLKNSYVWCQNRRDDVSQCVYGNLQNHRSLILMRESDYDFLDNALKDNYLLDQVDGFQIYGPYELSESNPIPQQKQEEYH